jgi:hypothetical protein
MAYAGMMTDPGKGTPLYPTGDAAGPAALRATPNVFIEPTVASAHVRSISSDVYKTSAGPTL